MLCSYPNCRQDATIMPVIALPTYRTVGLHVPTLDRELINNPAHMRKMQLDRDTAIRQYEAMTDEYKATVNNIVKTDQPTFLIGRGLCLGHKNRYKFTDWFQAKEWRLLQEAGRQKGVHVPEPHLLVISWFPLTWTPAQGYMEVER